MSKKYMDGLKKLLGDASNEIKGMEIPKFPKYKEKKKRRKITWLTEVEQDRVIESTPPIHRPIVTFIFYQGVRMGEARALKWLGDEDSNLG